MSDHTPTPNLGLPWYADQDQREGYEWNVHVVEHNNPNMRICFMANGPDSVERAAHLVKCVNAHDDLVRALEVSLNELSYLGAKHGYVSTETAIIRVLAALASIKETV